MKNPFFKEKKKKRKEKKREKKEKLRKSKEPFTRLPEKTAINHLEIHLEWKT